MGRPANALNSSSSTFCDPLGISGDGVRTAAAMDDGTAVSVLDDPILSDFQGPADLRFRCIDETFLHMMADK